MIGYLSQGLTSLGISDCIKKRGHNTLSLILFGWALVSPMGQEIEKAACVLFKGRNEQALTYSSDPQLDLPDLTESIFGHCMSMQIVI